MYSLSYPLPSLSGRGLVVELHGLLRTEMDAGEALRAVVAAMGFAIRKGDVALWTHVSADAAAYTKVGVDGGREHRQRAALHTGTCAQRADRSPPCVVQTVRAGGDFFGDVLQPLSVLLELPHLLVGIAPKTDGTVVGYADLLTVCQL